MDINQFSTRFDSEDACVKHLAKLRWPAGPVCDNCGETNRAWKRAEPRSWVCQACQHSFSVTAGTPLHKVKLPLPKVFMAVYLVAVSSKGTPVLRWPGRSASVKKPPGFCCSVSGR